MSHYQSRAERSESLQYKKASRSGSFNQQYNSGSGRGGGSSAPSNTSNPSFKRNNSNGHGGQLRPRGPNLSVDSSNSPAVSVAQNGPHQQQPSLRTSDAPSPNHSMSSSVKQTDDPNPNIKSSIPKTPTPSSSAAVSLSNVPTIVSDSQSAKIPPKVPGDASRSFPLQFGSISPGFVNGMQIPARTSSAPPNLDEQKKDKARQEALRTAPAGPAPSIPKYHSPRAEESRIAERPNPGEAQLVPKSKKDTHVSSPTHVTQTQNSSAHSTSGVPMQLPPHQPQVPVHFGGSNPHIQPQPQPMHGTSFPMAIHVPMSMQMHMPLPMGNPSVQQSMFVPGLQAHTMHSQGMMHQGQNLNFSSQMGHQIPPQLTNIGINIAPQFPHQPAGKYVGTRKTVKITHPETHEELRLDGSSAPRSHPNVPSQSQPIPKFHPSVPVNYYPGPYNASNSVFFPSVSSVSLSSAQAPPSSQTPRLYNQITVKPAGISHGEKDTLIPSSSSPAEKGESSNLLRSLEESSVHAQKEFEPRSTSFLQMSKPGSGIYSEFDSTSGRLDDLTVNEAVNMHDSIRDKQKIPGFCCEHNQVDLQSNSSSQSLGAKELETQSSNRDVVLESAKEPRSKTIPITLEASVSTSNGAGEGKQLESPIGFLAEGVNSRRSKPEAVGRKEDKEAILSESSILDKHSFEGSLQSGSVQSLQIMGNTLEIFDQEVKTTSGGLLDQPQQSSEELLDNCSDDVQVGDNLVTSTGMINGGYDSSMPMNDLLKRDGKTSVPDKSVSVPGTNAGETTATEHAIVDHESFPLIDPISSADDLKLESEGIETNNGGLTSLSPSSMKDKVSDPDAAKSLPRIKKKLKDLYKKAEAAGTSSDLYMAYKGPEEKKEPVISVEDTQNSCSFIMKQTSFGASQDNERQSDEPAQSKVEPDDWEDAAEISSPKLVTSRNKSQSGHEDGNELITNRYSRDFLIKFAEHCTEVPEDFEVPSDILDMLMVSSVNTLREPYPSPGRNSDRPIGGSRPDRRGSGIAEENKWNKLPSPPVLGRGDVRANIGYVGNIIGHPAGQGGNNGVLRNPRSATPIQYAGGILSGPMQPLGPQGGMQRYNSDSERWQRGTGFQKGLMSSPLSPLQVMHKAEKKYEVGKVSDEEEAKQRQLKAILNKLTPQNFEKLFEQVKQVNVDNVATLTRVISQIFDKALMEPTFCEMYANFCFHLAADLPELSVESEKITFKRLLLNKCQEEFEKGEREEEEANKADEEGEVTQTTEEREEKRLRARRLMLGNIRLIGELYKKRMLTERIMYSCIYKLLGQYENPDEENVEALCKLMTTIGDMIDHSKAKEHMDPLFDMMLQMSNNMKLSSRVRFMLKDIIDLRKNYWQQRRKVEGPKKIEEVHRDAAQERHAQASRLARAPSFTNSVRRAPPMDFTPRVPGMLSSPNSQMSGLRAVPTQLRGSGSQDFRNKSVPLPQGPLGDDSLTLGPQGGLARGMVLRGQPSVPNIPMAEVPNPGDSRRIGSGLNRFSSTTERTAYGQREDLIAKNEPDKFSPKSFDDQSHPQEENNSEKVWPEERLRDTLIDTIKEFYSVKDENEVTSCIQDLNAPSLYPSMISIWVTDSFERGDTERDLLTKLLINLAKSRDTIIGEEQLVKGFESVLALLEDTVSDAPRAAEFLGHIFAKIILDNVISLSEIGRLLLEGGEEQGHLVEIGLAAEVLGSLFETIHSEKGDSVLKEIHSGSNLRLENFKPPGSNKYWKIDRFI